MALMTRRKKPVVQPPPSLTGLAVSRGGVTASGIPSTARFGQCADFYDIVGVNIHFRPGVEGGNPMLNTSAFLADLGALGVRHVRDSVAASFIDSRSYRWRHGLLAMRNRNLNLPAGEQPVWATLMVPGHPGYQPFTHRTGGGGTPEWTVEEWFNGFEGGQQHRDGAFNLIPNGTTSNPNADIPNPWAIADSEFPWEIIDAIEGTNEPNGTAILNLRNWMLQLTNGKNSRTSTTVYGDHPVVTVGGISSSVKANQLPTVGPSIINAGHALTMGDWTANPPVEYGNQHPYHPGQEPSVEHWDENVATGNTSGVYNGWLRSPQDTSKHLPWFITEFGEIDSGMDQSGFVFGNHAAYWPSPQDVSAEYLVRQIVLYYRLGVARCYIYYFYDEANDPNSSEASFGLLKNNRTKKEQFYSVRNLLSLVEFEEAAVADRGAIAYTTSGFSPQGAKYVAGSNSVVANGSGFNQHYAMFQASNPGAGPVGSTYAQTADRLDSVLLQQSDDTYIVILSRQVMLWDREPGNWNLTTNSGQTLGNVAGGRFTPNTQTITVNFPGGISSAVEATPTAGGATTPEDGRTWSSAKTITGGTSVTVSIAGKTKLLKVTV